MKADPSEKLLEWSEKIKAQKLSNKSASAWCREAGISYHTFQYWQKRLKRVSQQVSTKKHFVEIREESPLIEISLRGVKLTISRDCDRSALLYFLSLLKGESC